MTNSANKTRYTLCSYTGAFYCGRPVTPVCFGTIADACTAAKALRTSVEVRTDSGEVVGWARARGEWIANTPVRTVGV